ncbi:MAG TPA: ABC transporter permease [bacterium]|nr:ABC transporter permease [bacterium]
MARYVGARVAQAVPVLFLVTVLVFSIIHLTPGDPAYVLLGPNAMPDQVRALRAELGLDRPLPVQYAVWLGHVVRGDLGRSYLNGFPVIGLIDRAWPVTLSLTIGALLVALGLAFPLSLLAVRFRRTWVDHATVTFVSVAYATPTFWIGILLIFALSLRLRWFPPSGYVPLVQNPAQGLRLLVMPSIALGCGVGAVLTRFLRATILETLAQEYVRTARAKGVAEPAVLYRHAARNALIPVVTVLGLQFGTFMGGAVLTEAIFGLPGVGRLLWNSVLARDYAVVQAMVLATTVAFVLINIATDLCYGLLDPRIRYG